MSNSYASPLLTQILEEQAVTVLSDVLAPVSAFARQFSVDRYKPRATAEVKFVTAGATTQKNATDFENSATSDSTVTNVQLAPDLYTQSFQISNADLNSGLRLADLAEKNLRVFGETLLDAIFAPLTDANFAVAMTRAPAAFAFSDMATAWGMLKKSPIKYAVLDGEFMARIVNTPVFYQATGKSGTDNGGWKSFGWDGIYECSRWSGAGANVHGFFCGPTALGVLAGLPLQGQSNTLESKVTTVPGLELSVQANSWFSLKSRSMFGSYDLVMGVAKLDATCGFLLKSA